MLTPAVVLPASVFAAVLVFLIVRARLPFLRVVPSPVEHAAQRRADDAEKELERANAMIDHLSSERDALLKERSLQTVIDLVTKVSHGVEQTLTKLADLNGGLGHTADALRETNEAMKTSTKAIELLASQIIIDVRGRE